MNIYVANLPREIGDQQLREAFEAHGQVTSAKVITDRYTGQPRGFAFVEMPNSGEAHAAINALNGTEMGGRTLRVEEARPRTDRREGYRDSTRGGKGRRW